MLQTPTRRAASDGVRRSNATAQSSSSPVSAAAAPSPMSTTPSRRFVRPLLLQPNHQPHQGQQAPDGPLLTRGRESAACPSSPRVPSRQQPESSSFAVPDLAAAAALNMLSSAEEHLLQHETSTEIEEAEFRGLPPPLWLDSEGMAYADLIARSQLERLAEALELPVLLGTSTVALARFLADSVPPDENPGLMEDERVALEELFSDFFTEEAAGDGAQAERKLDLGYEDCLGASQPAGREAEGSADRRIQPLNGDGEHLPEEQADEDAVEESKESSDGSHNVYLALAAGPLEQSGEDLDDAKQLHIRKLADLSLDRFCERLGELGSTQDIVGPLVDFLEEMLSLVPDRGWRPPPADALNRDQEDPE